VTARNTAHTLLRDFGALAANDLFMQAWISLTASAELASLADRLLDAELACNEARIALRQGITGKIKEVLRLGAATVTDLDGAIPYLLEILIDSHVTGRRAGRGNVRLKLIIDPEDGGPIDEKHLEIVSQCTRQGVPTGTQWTVLRDRLATCTRPARVWTADRECDVQWDLTDPPEHQDE